MSQRGKDLWTMDRGRLCACVDILQSGIVLLHLIHPAEINDMYSCAFGEQLRKPSSETFQL